MWVTVYGLSRCSFTPCRVVSKSIHACILMFIKSTLTPEYSTMRFYDLYSSFFTDIHLSVIIIIINFIIITIAIIPSPQYTHAVAIIIIIITVTITIQITFSWHSYSRPLHSQHSPLPPPPLLSSHLLPPPPASLLLLFTFHPIPLGFPQSQSA